VEIDDIRLKSPSGNRWAFGGVFIDEKNLAMLSWKCYDISIKGHYR